MAWNRDYLSAVLGFFNSRGAKIHRECPFLIADLRIGLPFCSLHIGMGRQFVTQRLRNVRKPFACYTPERTLLEVQCKLFSIGFCQLDVRNEGATT